MKLRKLLFVFVLVLLLSMTLGPIASAQGPNQGPDLTDPVQLQTFIEEIVSKAFAEAFTKFFAAQVQQTTSVTDTVQSAPAVELPDEPCAGYLPLNDPALLDVPWSNGLYGNQELVEAANNRCRNLRTEGKTCSPGEIQNVYTSTLQVQLCIDPGYSDHGFTTNKPAKFWPLDAGVAVDNNIFVPNGLGSQYSMRPAKVLTSGEIFKPSFGLSVGTDTTGRVARFATNPVAVPENQSCSGYYDLGMSIGYYGDMALLNAMKAEEDRALTAGEPYVPGQLLVSGDAVTTTLCIDQNKTPLHGIQTDGSNWATYYSLPGESNGCKTFADGTGYICALDTGRYALGRDE